MNARWTQLALGTALATALAAGTAGAAGTDDGETVLGANLEELNDSNGLGAAGLAVDGDQVTVRLRVSGTSPMLPHAQHIHLGGSNECPDMSADDNGDGIISTAEGQPAYGGVRLSLTTEGDTGPGSALAVERFPTADEDGVYTYSRTFTLPDELSAEDLADGVIVVHGISELYADKDKYDGEPRSSLDSSLPLEATVPSLCGELEPVEDDDGLGLGIFGDDGILNIFGDDDEGILENPS